jgi:hypothetical protein
MSYAMMTRQGLGVSFSPSFSILGQTVTAHVNLPVEDLAQQGINLAMAQLQARVPELVQAVVPAAMNAALPAARDYIIHTLWPDMKPLLRNEVNVALKKASAEAGTIVTSTTKTASIFGGILITGILGAAIFVVRSRRK